MIDPLVTIVTPSFNQGRFIRATIESVLEQDYPRIEYIVMDGGSTDETAEVVAEYSGRLTWISEPDRGQSHAINKGFQMARGEVVAWINSDDVLFPGAVARGVEALSANSDLGAVYGEGSLMDEAGRITGRFPATEPFNLWKLVHVWDYVLQQSVYFRKSTLDEVGYVDESLNWALDWDLLIRIGRRYELGYIPEEMGALREYDAAKSFSGGGRRFRELVETLRRHGRHRYPPGYFVYGLDTYQGILTRYLERLLPASISGRLNSWLSRTAHARIAKVLREAQGVYAGGWATARIEWMLPTTNRRIRIQGSLPDLSDLAGQTLRVSVDGVEIGTRSLEIGNFDLELDLPETRTDAHPLILIEADRSVPASSIGLLPEQRPVSYVLQGISGSK